MQTEQQTQQAATAPEIATQAESGESKQSKRGGKRSGAGRKPNLAKRLLKGFSREALAEGAADVDVRAIVVGLLKDRNARIRLDTLIFYRDTFLGRPAQNVQLSGGVMHAHAWRPLASLSDEEVAMLDKLTRKLSQPVLDASPNAPQNQIESNTAIEAEIVGSDAIEA